MTLLHRTHDAAAFNALVNDPTIYPWVRGPIIGPIDLAPVVENPANVFLAGEHGGFAFLPIQPAIYDVHAQVRPSGRGGWMLRAAHEAAWRIFTETDALEIVARVPHGNRRVRALATSMGMRRQFTIENGWVLDGRVVSADIYSLTLQDWLANDALVVEMGNRVNIRISRSVAAGGVLIPGATARLIAVVLDMIRAGQELKANIFDARYAGLARTPTMSVMSRSPLAVEICGVVFVLRGEHDYFVASIRPEHHEMKAAS